MPHFQYHLLMDGHPGWLHFFAVVDTAHTISWYAVFEDVPRNGIAGSYNNSISDFWETFIYNGCTDLHSFKQWTGVPLSSPTFAISFKIFVCLETRVFYVWLVYNLVCWWGEVRTNFDCKCYNDTWYVKVENMYYTDLSAWFCFLSAGTKAMCHCNWHD